jgi:allophanate hydrolase subunit 2
MIAFLGELWAAHRFPCQPPVALPEDLARISDGLYMTERGIVRIRGGVITATLGSESGDLMDLIGPHPKAKPRPLTPGEAIQVAREASKD